MERLKKKDLALTNLKKIEIKDINSLNKINIKNLIKEKFF